MENKKPTIEKKSSYESLGEEFPNFEETAEYDELKSVMLEKLKLVFWDKLQDEINTIIAQNQELELLSKELSILILNEAKKLKYYGTGKFIKPTKGWISSRFGLRYHPIFKRKIKHTGIDIAAPKGNVIHAVDSGKVIFSGNKGGYGKCVLLYHGINPKTGKTLSTFYAHQSRVLVKKGDIVDQGDEIGWVGQTGFATGPHLHFEVKVNGKHVNPLKYIPI